MSQDFDIDELLCDWRLEFGTFKRSAKSKAIVPIIEPENRLECLCELIKHIKEKGELEDYFDIKIKNKIIDNCIPIKGSVDNKTYEGYRNGTKQDLNFAIRQIYKKKEVFKKSIKIDCVESKSINNTIKNTFNSSEKLDKKIEENDKPLPFSEVFDINKHRDPSGVDQHLEPPINDVLDDEIATILGLKKDE